MQWEYQEDVIFSKRSYIAPSRIIHAIVLSLIMLSKVLGTGCMVRGNLQSI